MHHYERRNRPIVKLILMGSAITLGILVALFVIRCLIVEINFGYDNLAKDERATHNIRKFDSQLDEGLTIFASLEANCQAMYRQGTTQAQTDAATQASDKLDAYFKYVRAVDDFHRIEKEYRPSWFLRLIPSFRRRYENVQSTLDADLPDLKRKLTHLRTVRSLYDGACKTGNLHYRPIGDPWVR